MKTQIAISRWIRLVVLMLLGTASLYGHGFNVLVFTKTSTNFHDAAIAAGITALQELGVEHDFGVTQTDSAATFIANLPTHQVVVFLNTSGDVLDAAQETAFESWYTAQRGFVGIHAAADTEASWPWYLDLVGAEFSSHPAIQTGTVKFLDQAHPITDSGSPRVQEWSILEEWYNFTQSPRGNVHVLAVLDELVTTTNPFGEAPDTGVTGGAHGNDHPIIWCHEFDGGRSAYIGPGHRAATYSDATFRDMIVNSIEWAAGETNGDSDATIDSNWEKVVLESNLSNPMSIDLDENGIIYLIERFGAVKTHDESTGITTLIGTLDEYSGGEYGGLGLVLAPDFETSNHLYILWSPSSGDNTRISRFTLNATGDLDLSSEVVILEYLTNRLLSGHHQAGCLRFDPDGNLIASIGDNTQASQYSPRNDGSIGRDARKSAPNTNDLRGKIIRITPNVGGGPVAHPNYTIPSGNLFAPGTPLAREEIYAMGCRNPFRICIDPVNGWVYFGDVGPDATNIGSGIFQGPGGHDEFNQVKGPGWYGWPYYIGNNKPYFDGSANPWNATTYQADLSNYFTLSSFTGSGAVAGDPSLLGNPEPAWIWYPDQEAAPAFSELDSDSGRCALAGAVYQYASGYNFPKYFDGSVFVMLWSRNQILDVKTRPDGSILEITQFAPNLSFNRPHEMVFGPNGAMYLIEWGSEDLVKVQYTEASATPVTVASSDVSSGSTPLTVQFSSAGTFDPDSAALTYSWDFDGDQIPDSTDPNPLHIYNTPGNYVALLTVTDDEGLFSRANIPITVGNFAPVVTFTSPPSISFFDWGDTLNFSFEVTDVEDGSSAGGQISDAEVLFEGSLGHADHQHNEFQANFLSGNFSIPRDDSHPFDLDLSFVLDAYYTDEGAPGVNPVQSTDRVYLQPKITMAQTFDGHLGVSTDFTTDPVGGDYDVTSIDNGDYIFFDDLNLESIGAIRLRAAAGGAGGNVQVRQDSPTGNLIGTVTVSSTGANSSYMDFGTVLSGVQAGPHAVYFVFSGSGSDMMRLNWINFRGQGATATPDLPVAMGTSIDSSDSIRILFNQAMDMATISDVGNYNVGQGAVINSVVPDLDQSSVVVNLSGISVNSYYTISMTGLEDLAGDVMMPNSSVTFLHQTAAVSSYYFGLNAGGPDFTDSNGHVYIADTTVPNAPVTLLVDLTRTNNGAEPAVASDASHFAVADTNINLSSSVNVIDDSNPSSIALTATNLSGATFSNSGSNGIYSTEKGEFDGTPLLDGYAYENQVNGSTATLSGLGDISSGSPMTLTLWGVGDVPNADTQFTVTYNGTQIGSQSTDYDAASPTNTAPARVQFLFNKVQGADSITIVWGKASSATTGFCALSLTSPEGTPTDGGFYYSAGTARSYTDSIAGTVDDVLYQSERYANGNFSYSIPVEPGTYDVLLRLTENFYSSSGQRSFNVSVEDGPLLFSPELDLVDRVGAKVAFDEWVRNVSVTDSVLDIEFLQGSANNPKASAVGVFQVMSTVTPLPDPSFARYLQENPSSLHGVETDVDLDGLSTLLEYALGGSDSSSDIDRLPEISLLGSSEVRLSFTRPDDLPDVAYELLATADLSSWTAVTPLEATSPLGGGMEQVEWDGLVNAAATAGVIHDGTLFFCLRVRLTDLP